MKTEYLILAIGVVILCSIGFPFGVVLASNSSKKAAEDALTGGFCFILCAAALTFGAAFIGIQCSKFFK